MGKGRTMSIKSTVITVFVLVMAVAAASIAYLIFSRWYSSAESTVMGIADSINTQIHSQIVTFMEEPVFISESNHKLFRDGILDIHDVKQRERYFVGALGSFGEEIYSFSYGSADGEYHGARRNEDGVIEIMRNDASTGGQSWYYTVGEDSQSGELAVKLGLFDPRTRAWYRAAAEAGGIAFSPPYKHFVMDDLAISVAVPIYTKEGTLEGVLGTHLLLMEIGTFLAHAASAHDGAAIIVERGSGLLIANSMGTKNFSIKADGSWQRIGVDQLGNTTLRQAFDRYTTSGDTEFAFLEGRNRTYIDVGRFQAKGVDWIIISAIPGGFLLNQVLDNIMLTAILILLAILVLVLIYHMLTTHLFKPIGDLLKVSASLSDEDLSKRVPITRNDEIGKISASLNHVADNLQLLFDNLETNVRKRTSQLHEANRELEASRDRLSLLLNSTAEGIYGIDTAGNCVFCNSSALKMLGYQKEGELLGKNMHVQIHHTLGSGEPFPLESCKIYKSIREGTGYMAEDEVFWRKDGSSFPVAYHAFPQIREGTVLGGVITFMDITERRRREQEIEYLRCHDPLTGLHNRSCFEEHYPHVDVPGNLPLSVIFADVNALKMTNDIFGHTAGDSLIRKSADILRAVSRDGDILARFGGDEFVMFLPRTTHEEAQAITQRIRANFSQERIKAIRCSISLGIATKEHLKQPLSDVMINAENDMYKEKTKNRSSVNRDIIETLQENLQSRSPREAAHAKAVRDLALALGSALDLPHTELSVLERTACLHDIGKVTLETHLLDAHELDAQELELMRQHPVTGYRILNLFDDTLDLAEPVYSHHERWDGSGYPRGLQKDQIPLISRILAIAEAYERMCSAGLEKDNALKEIMEGAGTRFDPHLAQVFVSLMEGR